MPPVLANLAIGLAGFLAGMFLWVVVWRWIALLYTTIQSKRPLIWFTPVVAVLHPAMWMLAGFGYLVYRVSARPMSGWTWLVGGIAVGLLFQGLTLAWAWRRIRTKRTSNTQAP